MQPQSHPVCIVLWTLNLCVYYIPSPCVCCTIYPLPACILLYTPVCGGLCTLCVCSGTLGSLGTINLLPLFPQTEAGIVGELHFNLVVRGLDAVGHVCGRAEFVSLLRRQPVQPSSCAHLPWPSTFSLLLSNRQKVSSLKKYVCLAFQLTTPLIPTGIPFQSLRVRG